MLFNNTFYGISRNLINESFSVYSKSKMSSRILSMFTSIRDDRYTSYRFAFTTIKNLDIKLNYRKALSNRNYSYLLPQEKLVMFGKWPLFRYLVRVMGIFANNSGWSWKWNHRNSSDREDGVLINQLVEFVEVASASCVNTDLAQLLQYYAQTHHPHTSKDIPDFPEINLRFNHSHRKDLHPFNLYSNHFVELTLIAVQKIMCSRRL